MWKSVLLVLGLVALSTGCHRKHLQKALLKGEGGAEVHHHHYNEGGPQALPHQQEVPYGVQETEVIHSDEPAKHVVVLQNLPQRQPVDEDLFESIFPKKLHPKHLFKHHAHKLRSKFRDLLFDEDEKKHKHGHHHHHHARPHTHPAPTVIYQPQQVAVPALKVPLVQVEAYKAAPPGHTHVHTHAHSPGHVHYTKHNGNKQVVAYVSPDGYQPAVVVKHKQPVPHEHIVPAEPHPPPQGPPTYYAQPVPQQEVVYHQQPQPQYQQQPQPVAYHTHTHAHPHQHQHQPQQIAYQPVQQVQVQQVQHQPSPIYGPQQQQQQVSYGQSPYQPYGTQQETFQSTNFFGSQNPYGQQESNPFSSSFDSSSLFK